MTTETTAQPYAVCKDCPEQFADAEEMRAHFETTMATVDDGGVTARSHGARIVNPTPEEVEQSKVRSTVSRAIDDGMNECFNALDREIRLGYVTEEAVTAELRGYPDFSDGWDEWRSEGDR